MRGVERLEAEINFWEFNNWGSMLPTDENILKGTCPPPGTYVSERLGLNTVWMSLKWVLLYSERVLSDSALWDHFSETWQTEYKNAETVETYAVFFRREKLLFIFCCYILIT